jgi:hypothetical protein
VRELTFRRPKKAEAPDVPTTESLQSNYNRELNSAPIARTRLPTDYYRTGLAVDEEKISSLPPLLLVLLNLSPFQQLGTQATNGNPLLRDARSVVL